MTPDELDHLEKRLSRCLLTDADGSVYDLSAVIAITPNGDTAEACAILHTEGGQVLHTHLPFAGVVARWTAFLAPTLVEDTGLGEAPPALDPPPSPPPIPGEIPSAVGLTV